MDNRYVLLTAAKDEADYIAEGIRSILRQSILPHAWIIIDDGSSDDTARIVGQYAAQYPFIQLHSADSRGGRSFGSQYKALQAAYELAKALAFDYIAVQDGDLAPEQPYYYESLLGEFARNPRIGVASGFIYERAGGAWACRKSNSKDSTTGSAMFRRACFEEIGGYTPLPYGGSDWLAQLDAKSRGWEIFTRPDLHMLHYRPTSSVGGIWRGKFREGLMDASFGSHPAFEFMKCCRRISNSPVLFGSIVRFGGYLWWHLTRRKPVIASEKVEFLRKEQLSKLRRWAWPSA
ncbi:glycosyltransferase [Methylomicrobium agile]|uniref:glycosyltransferase n=1 Tax=Methylomicrobium agile TaxID=39774 RepID=UPI0004DF3FD7|nr:glycosyltransferase family A protein [Methylomicrobium agile]